jgi:hypothetical protein
MVGLSADGLGRYEEAARVLYGENRLEFDHPLALVTLSRDVAPSMLQSVRSISIDLQRHFYVYGRDNWDYCKSLHPDQWPQMWNVISTIQGLEEIRVSFRLDFDGWMGWTEEEVLEPLYLVRWPLKVFEVKMSAVSADKNSNHGDEERERPFRIVKF